MQLYLANRETESILFRPIRNNVVAAFTQLSQLLSQFYTGDELMLIACPLPEQVSVMLSSSVLAQPRDQQQQQQVEVAPMKQHRTSTTEAPVTKKEVEDIEGQAVNMKGVEHVWSGFKRVLGFHWTTRKPIFIKKVYCLENIWYVELLYIFL